jgi:hypothetical protein
MRQQPQRPAHPRLAPGKLPQQPKRIHPNLPTHRSILLIHSMAFRQHHVAYLKLK